MCTRMKIREAGQKTLKSTDQKIQLVFLRGGVRGQHPWNRAVLIHSSSHRRHIFRKVVLWRSLHPHSARLDEDVNCIGNISTAQSVQITFFFLDKDDLYIIQIIWDCGRIFVLRPNFYCLIQFYERCGNLPLRIQKASRKHPQRETLRPRDL